MLFPIPLVHNVGTAEEDVNPTAGTPDAMIRRIAGGSALVFSGPCGFRPGRNTFDFFPMPAYLGRARPPLPLPEIPVSLEKILVYVFTLVFCAVGLGIGYASLVQFEGEDTSQAWILLLAGLVFFGFGIGVFLVASASFRAKERTDALRAAHPREPWMWREDWASGKVSSNASSMAWFLWGFAILWNLISAPLAVFLPAEISEGNYPALLGFLFPLVGVGLLIAAIRKTVQRVKFGDSEFVLDRMPGVLGGEVAGTIVLPQGVAHAQAFNVRLACVHVRRVKSGKNTSTHETVLWQTEQAIQHAMPFSDGMPQRISVRFRTPYDAQPTDEGDPNNKHVWKLTAGADVPGVDFAAEFEVPVFKTDSSSAQITEESLRSEEVAAHPPLATSPDTTGITVVPGAAGGTEFIIKSNGNSAGSFGAAMVFLIFIGITGLIIYFSGPGFFALIFGAIGVVVAGLGVFGVYGESRIVVEDGHVSVRNILFGKMWGKRVPCESVERIGVRGDGKQGRHGNCSVTLTLKGGKSLTPMQTVSELRAAEWLAEEVRKAMAPWRGN